MAIDVDELRRLAIAGVKADLARLNALLEELEGTSPPERSASRRRMSPEARQRIAEATRARWAARRAQASESGSATPTSDALQEELASVKRRRGRPRRKT